MEKHIIEDVKKNQVDVLFLWRVLQGNIIKILLVAVLLAGALGVYRHTNTVPYYTTDVCFIVTGRTNSISSVLSATSSMNEGSVIAYNLPYIIPEDQSISEISTYLKEQHGDKYADLNRRSIAAMLKVEVDKQIVTVYVTGVDKERVKDVAEAVRVCIPSVADYFFGVKNADGEENIDSVAKALNNVYDEDIAAHGRNTVMYAGIGFIIGAVLVYLFCLLRTYFDNTVYSEDELKSRFTIPVIGQIPTWDNVITGDKKAFKDKNRKDRAKATRGSKSHEGGNLMSDRDYEGRLLTSKTPFAITEAFKALRTNMCYTTRGEKCAVYGITSAYVSAGKSLIVANVAASFSMMQKKVLLIDGDLRCPVQHKIFGLDNKVNGLSDVLAGLCNYDELYLRNGGYDNLDIITSGKIPPNPAELLASENMKNFIAKVKTAYDVVLIDLPPVSEVSDAGIISDLVTGFAFVVRSGYSDRRMIEVAVEAMEGFNASFIGFILNDVDIKSGDYYKNKYYNNYSKFRFRSGKSGYYRNFKYGYYKSGYSRGAKSYGNSYGGGNYGSSYSKANEQRASNADLDEQPTADGANENQDRT